MGRRHGITAMALALTLLGQPSTGANPPNPEHLAQVTPNTVTGRLDENSETLEDDGSYFNVHTFEGQAGEFITIEMMSEEFDTYLLLIGPEGQVIAQDDDGNGGTNSRIVVTLPTTGTYQIIANTYSPGDTGWYTLSWAALTAADVAQAETLQGATVTGQLDENSQVNDGRYFNVHLFEGVAGATVLIEMQSNDFDTYLALAGEDGNGIAQNYEWRGHQGSQIITTLPHDGTYQIIATHYLSEEEAYKTRQTGQYQLTWRSATREDILEATAHVQAMARARQLRFEAVELSADEFCCDEALLLAEEALDIYREQLGNNHPNVADNLLNVGGIYTEQLRFDEAEILLLEAVQIYRENLVDQYFLLARALNGLAILYDAWGRYSEAEELYIEALEIVQREQGLDEQYSPYVPSALSNLGGLYIRQGRYSEAERLHLEALEMRRERFGEDSSEVASSLDWLAYLYMFQGRFDEAEPLFIRVLEIAREQQTRRNEIAISLNNLARLYYAQGRYREAEPLFKEAINTYREILEIREGNILLNLATSLRGLGNLYLQERRFDEAEALLLEAQEIYRNRSELGEFYIDNAPNLDSLATVYQSQGDYASAEPLIRQAINIYRQQLGDRHPAVATSLNNLASLYQAQGNPAMAITYLQAGLDIEEQHLELNLVTLADAQRQAYAATISGTTNWAVSLHLQAAPAAPAAQQLALTTLLRRKGRILEAGVSSRQRLRQNLTPDDQATLDQLTDTQRQLATLTFNPPPNLPPDQYRAQLATLETTANQLESTLARRSATFRAEATPVDITAVQAQIPANGVLVEYVRYEPFNPQDHQNRWGAARYAAYLLFPDGRIEAVDLGDAAEIDRAVQGFVRLLQNSRANPQEMATRAQAISTLIFDPIAPHLQGREHLLISPDGQLNLLPFEALPAFPSPSGAARPTTPLRERGETYLVQQYQISYLNTGRDLVRFGIVPPSTNPAVLVGNPNYDTDTVQVASSRGTGQRATVLGQLQFGPLPGTAAELAALRPLFPNASVLEGNQATENALKQVQSPRILHIATHGFFLADVPLPPPPTGRGDIAIVTAGPGSNLGAVAPARLGANIENPLLRSGLALAGFNPRRSGSEDGVLTALEASQLNLFGTQLVVLSACDTGLGDVNNGEGVYGLRRAFAIAGAETQLLSLWQVDDFGTQSLMARYYQNLMAGMGRSQALRAVQLELIQSGGQYSHPYYWAAFVLAGDWRSLD